MARKAEEINDIEIHIADSWTTYKNEVWKNIYKEWEIKWCEDERHRLTKEFYPTPTKRQIKEVMALSRQDMKLWVEIVTGQNNLNYVQSKIYNISPTCRFCEEEDATFFHILTECPAFALERHDILLSRCINKEDWKLYQILKLAKLKPIKEALSFEQPQFLLRSHN